MRSYLTATTALLLVVVSPRAADAYPGGAPSGACSTLEPNGHRGAKRLVGQYPQYSITIPATAAPGDVIDVSIKGIGSNTFKGYMIQGIDGTSILGKFVGGNTVTCNNAQDTATQSNVNKEMWTSQTVRYQVPNMQGNLTIRGTVLQDYSNYDPNVYSNAMMVA